MTKDQLPEKLRNLPGLQQVTGEKVTVQLKDIQMKAFAQMYAPFLDEKEKRNKLA